MDAPSIQDDSPPKTQVVSNATASKPEVMLCRCCPCDAFPKIMLLCICFLTFGSYWVYDTPGAIQSQLQDWFGSSYSNAKNLALYSVYSWPNTVLALFGGYLIDRVTGVRLGAVLFCSLILIGQLMFCVGVQFKSYYVCLVGRFVFGLGGENLTVAQNAFTTRWFDGEYLALAFGLVVAFSRIVSSVNFVVTPVLANIGVPAAVWTGAGMCAVSMLMAFLASGLDWYGEPRLKAAAAAPTDDKPKEEDVIKFSDVKNIPLAAWLLNFICLFFYVGVLTFYTVASDIMQNTGNKYSDVTATMFLSIPNFVSIGASPLFGRLVDKKGYALTYLLVASVMMIVAQVLFLVLANGWVLFSPIPIMIWLGFGYALGAASLWPTLGCAVDPKMVGTAYGIMTAIQNLGSAVFPLVIGFLQDANGINGNNLQYTLPILIFIGCEATSFALTFILIGVDKRQNRGLMNASAEMRQTIRSLAQQLGEPLVPVASDSAAAINSESGVPARETKSRRPSAGEDMVYGTPRASRRGSARSATQDSYLRRLSFAT